MGLRTLLGLRKAASSSRIVLGDPLVDFRNRLTKTEVKTVFDVGANVGQSAEQIRRTYPRSRIYCFEPVPDSFAKLEESVRGDDSIFCHRLALAAKSGPALITARGTAKSNRLISSTHMDDPVAETRMCTGDDFCETHSVTHISFLKIDTEGLDLDVLLGFEQMLRGERIDIVQVEAGMNPSNKLHVPISDFLNFLSRYGYYLFQIYEQRLELDGRPILRRSNPVFVSTPTIAANTNRGV